MDSTRHLGWDSHPEALDAVLSEINAGLPNGQRYSSDNAAKSRAAWRVVQKHCPTKTKAQCREIIRTWLKNGVLREIDYDDPVYRRLQKGLEVDGQKHPDECENNSFSFSHRFRKPVPLRRRKRIAKAVVVAVRRRPFCVCASSSHSRRNVDPLKQPTL